MPSENKCVEMLQCYVGTCSFRRRRLQKGLRADQLNPIIHFVLKLVYKYSLVCSTTRDLQDGKEDIDSGL